MFGCIWSHSNFLEVIYISFNYNRHFTFSWSKNWRFLHQQLTQRDSTSWVKARCKASKALMGIMNVEFPLCVHQLKKLSAGGGGGRGWKQNGEKINVYWWKGGKKNGAICLAGFDLVRLIIQQICKTGGAVWAATSQCDGMKTAGRSSWPVLKTFEVAPNSFSK